MIKIVSRKSKLALWQANYVKQQLLSINNKLEIEIITIVTKGDKFLSDPLYKIGGKSLFVKELEEYLLSGKADIAVHSMKDVAAQLPEDLEIAAILKRDNPLDCIVLNKSVEQDFNKLIKSNRKIKIGTSSLRRQSQLLFLHNIKNNDKNKNLEVIPIRGNVDTRLDKLDKSEYDGIILAVSGLRRLNLGNRINYMFNEQEILPAIGQGAIGVECRKDNKDIKEILTKINDKTSYMCVMAEREINNKLNGTCQSPISGFARVKNNKLILSGLVSEPDGRKIIKSTQEIENHNFEIDKAIKLGEKVAEDLIYKGAVEIIEKCKNN